MYLRPFGGQGKVYLNASAAVFLTGQDKAYFWCVCFIRGSNMVVCQRLASTAGTYLLVLFIILSTPKHPWEAVVTQ